MSLNLAERRILQEFQKDPYISGYEALIQKMTNSNVKVEVDWASVENTEDATWVLRDQATWVRKYFFKNFEDGLTSICSDEAGKTAFKEKIKKIVFTNSQDKIGAFIENGVFTLRSCLRGRNGTPDQYNIQDCFEKNL